MSDDSASPVTISKIDETVGEAPMGMPVIAVDDPLLEEFALQHDLRERFFHALEMIAKVLDVNHTEAVTDYEAHEMLRQIDEIVAEALSSESLRAWGEQGRPLPWLDERLGDGPERLRKAILLMAGIEDGNMLEDER